MDPKHELDFKEMKELKDIYLAKKQGEAFERASTPLTYDESVSLGNFGFQAVYALGVIEMHQNLIHSLTGYSGIHLLEFIELIGRASGSINASRMEKTLETVGQLGQYMPMQKHQRQDPEAVNLND